MTAHLIARDRRHRPRTRVPSCVPAIQECAFEADPIAAQAIPFSLNSATSAFARVDREVARLLGGHDLLPIDLERYRLAGNTYWTCPSVAFCLAGGLSDPAEAPVHAAAAVTLLRILLEHHGAVPRRPQPGAGPQHKRDLDATLMVGDLVMSRITHVAATAGGRLGDAVLAAFVSLTASMVTARATPFQPAGPIGADRQTSPTDHPLLLAALSISASARRSPPGISAARGGP